MTVKTIFRYFTITNRAIVFELDDQAWLGRYRLSGDRKRMGQGEIQLMKLHLHFVNISFRNAIHAFTSLSAPVR